MAIVGAAEEETRKEKVSYSIPSLSRSSLFLDALDDSRAEAEATRNDSCWLATALVSIAPFAPTFSNIGIQIFFSFLFL
jgi:hypothetical protein